MRRTLTMLLLILLLTGCTRAPTVTNDGTAWSDDWVRVGATLGVEPPENGLTLLDNKDALSSAGLYYAAWTMGEKQSYINAEEETVDLYDAQLYLLLQDCDSVEAAMAAVTEWESAEETTYQVVGTDTVTCAGQEFAILQYEVTNPENPYSRGVSAFGVYENHAISAELSCQEGFDGDELSILTEFLDGIHYAREEES